jgi:transcriptional regulator with XRE-family HTH domain
VTDEHFTSVLTGVGPRLRALRQARGATLSQLSETTGISVSTLSRLESGQRKPTLELLLPLARAHHVPLDELVGAPATGDPRIHPRPFTRHGRVFVPLTRHLGGLHAYKMILPARQASEDTRPRRPRHCGRRRRAAAPTGGRTAPCAPSPCAPSGRPPSRKCA